MVTGAWYLSRGYYWDASENRYRWIKQEGRRIIKRPFLHGEYNLVATPSYLREKDKDDLEPEAMEVDLSLKHDFKYPAESQQPSAENNEDDEEDESGDEDEEGDEGEDEDKDEYEDKDEDEDEDENEDED